MVKRTSRKTQKDTFSRTSGGASKRASEKQNQSEKCFRIGFLAPKNEIGVSNMLNFPELEKKRKEKEERHKRNMKRLEKALKATETKIAYLETRRAKWGNTLKKGAR